MSFAKQLAVIPALILMTSFAHGQEVHYNYERGANFGAYRTYQWVDAPGTPAKTDVPAGLPAPPSGLPSAPAGLPALPGGLPNVPGGASNIRTSGTEDQLLDEDIKRAVDEQLAQKGFTKVDKNADVLVSYHAALHQELSMNLSASGWGGRGSGMWNGSALGQTSTIPVGTLVVDLYDPARKQLIWRGDATKSIEVKKDPNKNYKNLEKAVAKLLKNYPPPANK